MRMSYKQYQAVFFACRSMLVKNRPGNEASTGDSEDHAGHSTSHKVEVHFIKH